MSNSIEKLHAKKNELIARAQSTLGEKGPKSAEYRAALAAVDEVVSDIQSLEFITHNLPKDAPKPVQAPASVVTHLVESKEVRRAKMNRQFRNYLLGRPYNTRDLTTSTDSGAPLIPQSVFGTLGENLKAFAPILDVVTVEENTTGRPINFMSFDPTANFLTVQTEAVSPAEQDLSTSNDVVNHDLLTGKIQYSVQLEEDSAFDILDVIKRAGGYQLGASLDAAVITGKDPGNNALPNNANVAGNVTVGFQTASLAAGIKWTDITALVSSVNPAFAVKGKFVLSYGTYIYLLSQETTTGAKLYPELADGKLGRWDVIISPSMPQALVANNVQILFGDLSQIGLSYTGLAVQVLRERLADQLKRVALISTRVASTLLVPQAIRSLKLAAS
jgi:HK97 family phage major capsid protein